MGIFAKLNFRAVDAAYKDVAALSFVTFLSIECKQDCQYWHDVVDLQHIAERVAEERAGDILSVSTTRRDTDAALLRFGQVVRGLTKWLESEVGARPTVGDLLQILDRFFDLIAVKVMQCARSGHLNMSLSDADYFVTKLRLAMIDSTTHFRAVSQIIQEVQTGAGDKPVGGGAGCREVDRRPKHWEHTVIWDDYSKASIVKETVKLASSESSKPIASSDRDEATAPDQLSITKTTLIREIDRRPKNREYTGILDHDSNAAKTRETPSSPRSQPSKPKAHNVRDEPTEPRQAPRTSFCSPVTIESPSRAIRGEKLVEDVGLVTSSGDFIAILDKFSWLPHSRTSPIALATPTEGPVTVTFARRRSAFSPECTPLGTFLLTGFSGDKAVPNALEIRMSAEDSELYFDVRDAAGSHLTITRQS